MNNKTKFIVTKDLKKALKVLREDYITLYKVNNGYMILFNTSEQDSKKILNNIDCLLSGSYNNNLCYEKNSLEYVKDLGFVSYKTHLAYIDSGYLIINKAEHIYSGTYKNFKSEAIECGIYQLSDIENIKFKHFCNKFNIDQNKEEVKKDKAKKLTKDLYISLIKSFNIDSIKDNKNFEFMTIAKAAPDKVKYYSRDTRPKHDNESIYKYDYVEIILDNKVEQLDYLEFCELLNIKPGYLYDLYLNNTELNMSII